MRLTALSTLLITFAAIGGCKDKAPPPRPPRQVFAIRVADSSALIERAFPGRAKAAREVNLSFRVSGPLIHFPAIVGQDFKADDVLARLDPQDFETALRTLRGQLEREQARAKRAAQDLERDLNIQKNDAGAISQAAIDRARQLAESSQAGVRSIEASVQNAEDRLGYSYLKTPFDGTVVATYVENFETVVAKQPILRLLDPSAIELVINVPENLIGYAPYVETVQVVFDTLPDVPISATIKEIGKEASQATRTYPVTLTMAQPDKAEILPGMAGQATIVSRPPSDSDQLGIDIPATAVFTDSEQKRSFVWVIDDASKTLSRREVQVGGLSRLGTRVRSGLQSGEWIVTKGVNSVEDGQQVRILEAAYEGGQS
jgi:RND family efflux transporter MFP subunit